jgi:uridine phosphorylase
MVKEFAARKRYILASLTRDIMARLKQYHIGVAPGDVARYVLLPGDPGRVEFIASFWDKAEKMGQNREYVVYTGKVGGVPISCCSTGIGGPAVAIAVEELSRCGADTLIRVGTAGGLQPWVKVGDVAISDAAVRLEGTSRTYVRYEYPAVASYDVVLALIESAVRSHYPYVVGITRSGDAFYSQRPISNSFKGYWQSEMENVLPDLVRANVVSGEMEASVVFTLARLFGLRASAVCAVLDNVLEVVKKGKEFDPTKDFEHKPEYIERAAQTANGAVKILAKWDKDREAAKAKYWHPTLSFK